MKMLRRFLALAVSMALAASLVACGSGSGTESGGSTAGSTPSSGEKRALCMGTGSSSGAWYIIGGGISNAVNLNSSQFTITNEASSGGGENLRNLQEGNVDIVMLNCDMGYFYYTSTDSYEGAGSDTLRSMIAMPSSPMHIVVKAGSGIDSLDDLKGKSIAVGTAAAAMNRLPAK